MSIESDFYLALSADPGVSALVDDRIYPMLASPKAETPYITWQIVSGAQYDSLADIPSRERKVVQINCIADTALASKNLGQAVKSALHLHRGYLQSEGDDYFDATQKFRVRIDWSLIG